VPRIGGIADALRKTGDASRALGSFRTPSACSPIRARLWDEFGTTMVGFRDPDELANTYRLDREHKHLQRMRTLLAEPSAEAAAVA
jgi:hypothetical protein